MSIRRTLLALSCALGLSGCLGTEAGNPSVGPWCSTFVFGLIEGDFTVPENAAGIALQVSESLRSDHTLVATEFGVTRNGVPESGFTVTDEAGVPLDPSRLMNGRLLLVLAEPLAEGDLIRVDRRIDCDDLGTGYVVPDQTVSATVGPRAAPPTSAGTLSVAHGSVDTTVVLPLSPELVPWRHLIVTASLHVGETVLRDGFFFVDDEDRDLDWRLSGADCRSCGGDIGGGADEPPTVCYPNIWPASTYPLFVRAEVLGLSEAIDSTVESTTFDAPRCSQ